MPSVAGLLSTDPVILSCHPCRRCLAFLLSATKMPPRRRDTSPSRRRRPPPPPRNSTSHSKLVRCKVLEQTQCPLIILAPSDQTPPGNLQQDSVQSRGTRHIGKFQRPLSQSGIYSLLSPASFTRCLLAFPTPRHKQRLHMSCYHNIW